MGSLEEDYAQSASPVSILNAILEGYPLSVGILREILANSDDAGASKQVRLANVLYAFASHLVKRYFF